MRIRRSPVLSTRCSRCRPVSSAALRSSESLADAIMLSGCNSPDPYLPQSNPSSALHHFVSKLEFQMKAALVFLTFLFSQVATPNRIADVQIRGNRRIPTETIKFNIQTKVGDTLNRDIIRRDVKTLYALSYFDDVRVDEEESPSGLIIMFVVKEKPIVRSIDYKGLNSITKAEVIIREMLAEKGRQNATVEAKTEDIPPNATTITFEVNEGPKVTVAKIDIEGKEVFSGRQLKH